MAKFTLDISVDTDVNNFEQTHELDGRLYLMRFQWNRRDKSWSVSFYLPDGTPLATGRKINLGVPLLNGEIDERLPPGMLLSVDLTQSDVEAAHDDIGMRIVLEYFDLDELTA
jgi:hypothetical protein